MTINIDPLGEKYYWTGTYEQAVHDLIAALLPKGGVFWDVGAHAGYSSLVAARAVGSEGRVHAFEPLPENVNRLERTFAANGLENVTVHPIALAAAAGLLALHVDANTRMGTLTSTSHGHADRTIEIPCSTLDAMCSSIGAPSLIKIDVEGAELGVLEGALALLAERHPPQLILELHEPDFVSKARALLPRHAFEELSDRHWLLRGAA